MGQRRRRRLRVVSVTFGVLLLGASAWAGFWSLYNPDVPLLAPQLVKRPARGATVTVVLAGDFAPADAALPLIEQYGYHYPYVATAAIMRGADVSFANLESPVTASRARALMWRKYSYRVAPQATAAWRWLGLDVINLANNHIGDYGDRGVLDTVKHLDAAGLAHIGAGRSESAARRPVIVDVGGTRVGFVGYLENRAVYNLYLRLFAVGDRVGCAQLNRADVAEDLRRLRPLVDVLIVSVHWGDNYAPVTRAQQRFGRWLVDHGADVVVGHHPHDIQPVDVRHGSVILYSLGNYAWGAPGHDDFHLGLLARLSITPRAGTRRGRLAGVELLPIVTQNRVVNYQPRRLAVGELRWLDSWIGETQLRGTRITVDGTRVGVHLR